MAAAAILPELATQVLIPVAAAVGIAFAVVQWVLVSKVRVTPERRADGGAVKSGPSDYLIEEEEGLNDHNVVVKCAEIQTAISEGERLSAGSVFGWLHILARVLISLHSLFEVGTRGCFDYLGWMLLEMIETLRALLIGLGTTARVGALDLIFEEKDRGK
jgi:hypothetical protein